MMSGATFKLGDSHIANVSDYGGKITHEKRLGHSFYFLFAKGLCRVIRLIP
jgi:hypothetical protein